MIAVYYNSFSAIIYYIEYVDISKIFHMNDHIQERC